MIMLRRKRFKPAIEDFAAHADKPFTSDEAVEAIRGHVIRMPPEPELEVANLLEENENLFLICRNDGEQIFLPRRHFFRGGHFRLVPSEAELKGGYLVPGHRFLPFCSRAIHPADCRLEMEDGSVVPVRRERVSTQDCQVCFTMMRADDFIQYVIADDPENSESLDGEGWNDVRLSLRVLDMTEAYRRSGFQPGDIFVAEVVSWLEGQYRLKRMAAADLEPFRFLQARWYERIEEEIRTANEDGARVHDPCEQAARALAACGSGVLRWPGVHVGGFIRAAKTLSLTAIGHGAILWERDKNPADALAGASDFRGSVGSLESILRDLAISYDESEVEAFMRDELFRGGNDVSVVRRRILAGRTTVFRDEDQERQFETLLQELWEDVKDRYERKNDEFWGPHRAEVLRLLEYSTDIIRGLDRAGLTPANMPKEALIDLATPTSTLSHLAAFMNESSEDGEKEAKHLVEVLNSLETAIQGIAAVVQAKGETKSGATRRRRSGGGKGKVFL